MICMSNNLNEFCLQSSRTWSRITMLNRRHEKYKGGMAFMMFLSHGLKRKSPRRRGPTSDEHLQSGRFQSRWAHPGHDKLLGLIATPWACRGRHARDANGRTENVSWSGHRHRCTVAGGTGHVAWKRNMFKWCCSGRRVTTKWYRWIFIFPLVFLLLMLARPQSDNKIQQELWQRTWWFCIRFSASFFFFMLARPRRQCDSQALADEVDVCRIHPSLDAGPGALGQPDGFDVIVTCPLMLVWLQRGGNRLW